LPYLYGIFHGISQYFKVSYLNAAQSGGPQGDRTPAGPADLRVKSNFSNRIKLFLPVQSHTKKYSDFPKPQITLYPQPSTPHEGRIAIVTDAGLDAMDAGGA
jgi:hypothetical protein